VVPSLIAVLKDNLADRVTLLAAIQVISRIGPAGGDALPHLLKISRNQQDGFLSRAAARAIESIRGEDSG